MDIYNHLHQEHEKVSSLIDEMLETKENDIENRQQLFNELKKELITHSRAEEKTFYAILRQYDELKDLVEGAIEDHKDLEELLDIISNTPLDSPKWLDRVQELKLNVDAHVDEEEGEIFDEAKQVLSQDEAEDLSRQMEDVEKKSKSA